MSLPNRKVKLNVSRVRSALSALDNNFIKVTRYAPTKRPKVTFNKDTLNDKQPVLPFNVPEEILQQHENQPKNRPTTTSLKRQNKSSIKKVKKAQQSAITRTVDTSEKIQDLQKVRTEIDKMESKLISKRNEALKDLKKPSARQQKPAAESKIKIDSIEVNNATPYDPVDYMDEFDFTTPVQRTLRMSDEEFYINELKKKAVISDKLPFELGTKISPNDGNAVKKLREQLQKWTISDTSSPSIKLSQQGVGDASHLGTTVIREEPERDYSPLRSNTETEKSISLSESKNYPLDDYLTIKNEKEEQQIPERKLKNMNGVILLQTKASSLTKEAEKQLETPFLKPPDSSLTFELNSSESSESGRTEEEVNAVFYETTFHKSHRQCCVNCQKPCDLQSHICRFDFKPASHCHHFSLPSTRISHNFQEDEKFSAAIQKNSGPFNVPIPHKTSIYNHPNFRYSASSSESVRQGNVASLDQIVRSKDSKVVVKANSHKPLKQTVHWSSSLEKEYRKLSHINENVKSGLCLSKYSLERKKTHDACVNTDVPKVNTSFIQIKGKDSYEEKQSVKKTFQIQELPGVNIRPQLTKQTCPRINIISSKKQSKNHNVGMVKIVHQKDNERNDSSEEVYACKNKPKQTDQIADNHEVKTIKYRPPIHDADKISMISSSSTTSYEKPSSSKQSGKEKTFLEKERLLSTTRILRENPALTNDSFMKSLKTLESRVNEMYKYQLDDFKKMHGISVSNQPQSHQLPDRMNMVTNLLQSELNNIDTKSEDHFENFSAILQLLTDDITEFLDEYKRNKNRSPQSDDSKQGIEIISESDRNKRGHLAQSSQAMKKCEYIPYRKLYPGAGAKNREFAQTNHEDMDLRLTRIKKFYEINRKLYSIKSPELINDRNILHETKSEIKDVKRDSAALLNETFVIETQEKNGPNATANKKEYEVNYEEDWEELDENESEANHTLFEHRRVSDYENQVRREVQFQELLPMNDCELQNQTIVGETNSYLQIDKNLTNLHEVTKEETNYKNEDENNISKNLIFINQEAVNEKENATVNENINKNELLSNVVNIDTKDKTITFPFFKLTNPQTKSLVEIRFPEDHNTFKSSITVNSCASKDEIKLSYDRGEGPISSSESKRPVYVQENVLQNQPEEIVKEITPQSSIRNAQTISGNDLNSNLLSSQMFSSTFVEYLELKIRDILNNFQRPPSIRQNKEIQTNNYVADPFASHISYDRVQTSNLLPPYQSEANSVKSSIPNSTVPSEKVSEAKGALTDLEVPNLVLNVPKESSDSNINSNVSRTEVMQSTVEDNFCEEKKYENDYANYVNVTGSSQTLPDEGIDILNVKRLLPLPQSVISKGVDHENNSHASDTRREQTITEVIRDITSFPTKQEEITTAGMDVDISQISKDLLPLPSDIHLTTTGTPEVANNDRFSASDSSSQNLTTDNRLIQLEPESDHGLPTYLLPSPSVLNKIIQDIQEPSSSYQNVQDCSDDESIISCQNVQIHYYNSDEMSEGEIGFVYTSNTYSSGEVKPKNSNSENTSSVANSLSDDGKECFLQRKSIRLPFVAKQLNPDNQLISSNICIGEGNISLQNTTEQLFLEADLLGDFQCKQILEQNISLESESTEESTTTTTTEST